jgi:hypothetical protein
VSEQLKFLGYGIVPTDMPPTSIVTATHARFISSMHMNKLISMETLDQRSSTEVAAINLFFPDVQSDAIQICMAAWLSTLCMIDDILEEMHPLAARMSLEHSIDIVLGRKEIDFQGKTDSFTTHARIRNIITNILQSIWHPTKIKLQTS